jgi:hypothetical protein
MSCENKSDKLKKLLIKFLKFKDMVVFKETDIHLFSKNDYDDVNNWKLGDLKIIVNNLEVYSDIKMCPWCIINRECSNITGMVCTNCNYGKNHTFCDKDESTYNNIIDKLEETNIHSICELFEDSQPTNKNQTIIKKMIKDMKKLLENE